MKKLFSTDLNSNRASLALLVLRIGIGLLMLNHGMPKMAMLFADDPVKFASVFGMSAELSLGMAVLAEVFCSVLLIIGLGTRIAIIPLIITMLVAVVYIHGNSPFAKQELGILYLLAYVVLMITGSGKYSLDHLFTNKKILTSNATGYRSQPQYPQ